MRKLVNIIGAYMTYSSLFLQRLIRKRYAKCSAKTIDFFIDHPWPMKKCMGLLSMILTAYHGTDSSNVESIKTKGFIYSSEKEWLGQGIYFFESFGTIFDGISEAESWAKYVRHYSSWAVFEVLIESDDFFDLLEDIEHKKLYDSIRKEALQRHIEAGFDLKTFEERVIYIKLEESGVDFIRVLVNADKYKGYYTYTVRRPQIQICVKNYACIKETLLHKVSEKTL